MHYFRALASSY